MCIRDRQVSFRSFGLGLILATVLVYLILVAQFKSFLDPLLILLAVPTGLTGVLIILFATGTDVYKRQAAMIISSRFNTRKAS